MPTFEKFDKYKPIPYDHTYVLYDPKDVLAVCSVHMSLLPIYTMVFYTSWFLLTREIEPVIVIAGHMAGELVNKIFKRIVRQPRPDFHKDFGVGSYSLTYGMPSAHSQFMGFFAGYFTCVFVFKIDHFKPVQKAIGCATVVIAALSVAFSRVYLLYHTPQQVLVGLLFGAFLGLSFFVLISVARDVGLVDWVLSWPALRYFYVKDSYFHCYSTFKDEYDLYLLGKTA